MLGVILALLLALWLPLLDAVGWKVTQQVYEDDVRTLSTTLAGCGNRTLIAFRLHVGAR